MPIGHRPPPPSDVVRVAVSGDLQGMPWANVFWCHTDAVIDTDAGAKDFADAFRAAVNAANFYQAMHTDLHVTQFRAVIQLDADTAVTGINVVAINGANAGTSLMANECLVLSWLSPAYWRGGKPRTYVPGIRTANVDTNHSLLDSSKTALITTARGLRTQINAITTPAVDQTRLGFVSFQSGGEWRADPLFFEYSDVTIHDRIGTQRRRLGRWLP
jgi:hypothetical protein